MRKPDAKSHCVTTLFLSQTVSQELKQHRLIKLSLNFVFLPLTFKQLSWQTTNPQDRQLATGLGLANGNKRDRIIRIPSPVPINIQNFPPKYSTQPISDTPSYLYQYVITNYKQTTNRRTDRTKPGNITNAT